MNTFILLILCQIPTETMYISINDDFNSQLIQSELTRDWTDFNPSAELTEDQISQFKKEGQKINDLRSSLNLKFEFVRQEKTPIDVKVLSYKFGKYDEWEKIDERAFISNFFPLLTVEYLRKERFSDFYQAQIDLKNKENSERYYEDYDEWEQKARKILGVDRGVFFKHKEMETQAYDQEKQMWMIVAYPNTKTGDLAKIHSSEKYTEYYFRHEGLEAITIYEKGGGRQVDPKLVPPPPIRPRPIMYVPPDPPWKESIPHSSIK